MQFVEIKNLSNEFFGVPPKISKGENYQGLPYLILDHPRKASDKTFFFIRTLFWWGNFFSCTLHVSGETKHVFKERIQNRYLELQNFYVSTNANQWAHHLQKPDYIKIDSVSKTEFEEICENFDHIKIACKHPLEEWEEASHELFEKWKYFLSVCGLIS